MKDRVYLLISIMSNTHSSQKIIKIFCTMGVVISTVFLFTVSQHTVHAHAGILDAEHCTDPSSGELLKHRHPVDDNGTYGTPICGGTIGYAISSFVQGASVFSVLLQMLVGIVITAAFFYFFWNLVKYIRDEEGKDEAKTKMGYSLGAIFVIVTLWGIVGFMRGVLGIGNGDAVSGIDLPTVNFLDKDVDYERETIEVDDE